MKKSVLLGNSLLAMSLFVTACGGGNEAKQPASSQQPAASGSNVIKIATQSPLSGEAAEIGEEMKLGAELALKDNTEKFKAMGFDLQLVAKDDKGDAATGTANARALVTDPDILGLIGHLNSGVTAATGTIYEQAGLSLITPTNTNPKLSQNGWKVFHRIVARDDKQGPAGAQFMQEQGKSVLYLVNDSTDYGKGLAQEVEKKAKELGIKVVGHDAVNSKETEFNTIVTKVKAHNADAVYFGGMYAQAGQFLKQLSDKQYSGLFMGGDALDSEVFITSAGGAANVKNARITATASEAKTPEAKQFAERYEKAFNKKAGAFAVYGYDATLVMLQALEQSVKENGGKKPTREQVNKAVSATKNFKGLVTTVTFDENGDNTNAPIFVKSFEKGTFPTEVIKEIE